MGVKTALSALSPEALFERVDAALVVRRSQSTGVRRRSVFGAGLSAAWLAYLIAPIAQRWSAGRTVEATLGIVALVAFAAVVVAAFVLFGKSSTDALRGRRSDPRVWLALAALTGISAMLVWLFGSTALPASMYIAVLGILYLPFRASGLVVLVSTVTILLLPFAFRDSDFGSVSLYLAFVPVVIWIGRQLGLRGDRLAELNRRQRAELEIVEERNRVARDVHDILGHSLTVITVKTELAQRLVEVDLARAKSEMADIERLAREALAGVRETVGGLREISLRGELGNARTALAAADIAARLPDSDELPEVGDGELFGWVLREAVTNVIRHSAARECAVSVTETAIEVTDDGRGLGPATNAAGSGLSGLRERLRAAGGTLTLSTPEGGGLRVRATIPA
ncbi:sensor histidine kinase [Nocardia callitridis]|uniref:Sensor histidine kinase n=1 Tax=Nocardia callitridis TaxID=648753 RepID=A0ABP9L5K2_9NOCA